MHFQICNTYSESLSREKSTHNFLGWCKKEILKKLTRFSDPLKSKWITRKKEKEKKEERPTRCSDKSTVQIKS